MIKLPADSASCRSFSVAVLLALAAAAPVLAQPSNNSPNQFGDRQTGLWGDPGQGHFGNPAAGDFDKSKMVEPPPGTRPMGRVQSGKPTEASPYISLPTPADAVPAASAKAVPAAPKKKPAKKRAAKKLE